ncbi:hypothetical protein CONLIGDRAFT_122824 [Coniochaeta ligniaria NRRL 30616]|uniref:F-box domain-containing protein n=1 Tax=Coniochaeta ligniaria NRRL 30616 TaxID=1408157 RepID=A0A1J7J2I6_9PEZI|nr:hypothetical protein CONLIGDRAFT_122824 [Coniochaeta ligniaria NRRL 30616]
MTSSSTAPAHPDGSRQPPLLRLPLEIVHHIADENLSPSDCKSLRLTCHFFETSMIRPLFQRVFLSKTKLDRDSFFNIAQSPSLAAAARELIWYELAEDETVFFAIEEDAAGNPTPNAEEPVVSGISDDDAHPLYDSVPTEHRDCEDDTLKLPPLSTIARDAFWLTSLGSSQEYRKKQPVKYIEKLEHSRQTTLRDFLQQFYSALDAMPNIRTFVSCPMPSLRAVCNDDVYSLTAQFLQKGVGLGWTPQSTNEGFFHFLLPAMRRAGSKVERLTYVDEGLTSSLSRPRPCDIFAFKTLTHIDLCLGWADDEELNDLGVCLRAATGLVDLGICMEMSEQGFLCGFKTNRSAFERLFGTGEAQLPLWPHLRRLRFTDIRTSRSDLWPAHGDPLKALTRLLRAHASTLRHLSFHQCEVTRVLIEAMANVPGLTLESLQVNNNPSLAAPIVPASELLAYVNGKGPCPVNLGEDNAWNTETMIFDPHLMPTAALFDASTTGRTLYSNEHMASISDGLHPNDLHLLGSHHSLYTREKRAKLKLANNNSTMAHDTATGGAYPASVEMEGLPILKWLFKHPNGQEAVGDEPLEFFPDWEDSCDESGVDEDEDTQDAPQDDTALEDGHAVDRQTINSEGEQMDACDDDGSVFEGDEFIKRMEAPVTMPEKRYLAIPLLDSETRRQ